LKNKFEMKRIRELRIDNSTEITNIWHKLIPGFEEKNLQNREESISKVLSSLMVFDKTLFYPLIGQIFSEMGMNINVTRDGDTNNRADAIIIDTQYSIPIEIKSPTEIDYVNIKSVRQALENKIVLLSRKFYPTTNDCASLAIAMFYPEERSGVKELVEDFYKVYNLKVGYIDMHDLLSLHWMCSFENFVIDIDLFKSLKGRFTLT